MRVELATGGTKTITGKHILLAVGGKPVKAPIPGSVRALPLLAWHTCHGRHDPNKNCVERTPKQNHEVLNCYILVLMNVVALL